MNTALLLLTMSYTTYVFAFFYFLSYLHWPVKAPRLQFEKPCLHSIIKAIITLASNVPVAIFAYCNWDISWQANLSNDIIWIHLQNLRIFNYFKATICNCWVNHTYIGKAVETITIHKMVVQAELHVVHTNFHKYYINRIQTCFYHANTNTIISTMTYMKELVSRTSGILPKGMHTILEYQLDCSTAISTDLGKL